MVWLSKKPEFVHIVLEEGLGVPHSGWPMYYVRISEPKG